MSYIYIYIIAAIIIIAAIYYSYSLYSSENYAATSVNLIIVDSGGNMSTQAVTSPSLYPIPNTSNIVYVDANGNIGVMSPAAVYTSYPGNVKNLLTVNANNFSTISTNYFNPCRVNDDGTMNGAPQSNGTCSCRNNWSGTAPGDGCGICDGSTNGITHTDNTFGSKAGKDCEWSIEKNCNGQGVSINSSGTCNCNPGYAGPHCEYSDAVTCNNNGKVQNNGTCVCKVGDVYAGETSFEGPNCAKPICTYEGLCSSPQATNMNNNCRYYLSGGRLVAAPDFSIFADESHKNPPIDGVQLKGGCGYKKIGWA